MYFCQLLKSPSYSIRASRNRISFAGSSTPKNSMTHHRRCVFSWCCCRSGPGGAPGFPGCRWCCKRWERSPPGDPPPLQVHGLSPTRNHLILADLAADLAAAAPAVVDARASPSPPLCSSRFYGQCRRAATSVYRVTTRAIRGAAISAVSIRVYRACDSDWSGLNGWNSWQGVI